MEEKPHLSIINIEEDGGGGEEEDELYEKIEAPKFVDFTASSDPYPPDDRYWFCLRVGHGSQESQYPHKALNKKASSVNEKCPLSVPAKPSKSGISRLAVISSFSQEMVDARGKVKPLSKLSSTPNPKVKQVAAKYLTTPGNKNCLPSPNSFRSVQNPKPTSIAEPNNRTVAKALVFQSPKKVISIKTSSELCTPLTKICEGMKRLGISCQRKGILGYSNKSSKDIRRDPNKSLPLNPSRRKLSAYKDKSKAKELFGPPNCKEKGNKPFNSMPRETVENDLIGMEIDMKSRDSSVLGSSRITEANVCEEWLSTEKTSGNLYTITSTREEVVTCLEVVPLTKNSDMVLLDASKSEMNTSSNSKEGSLEENDFLKFEENSEGGNESSEGIDKERKTKASSEKREGPEDHNTESENLGVIGHEGEAVDSDDKENAYGDDKENALVSDGNRCEASSGKKIFRKQETNEITKKVNQTQDKNLKEGLTVDATGAQGVKYKKPKPTNPKPFRLRTDRNDKCLEQRKCNHDTNESSGNELQKNYKKDEPKQSRTASEGQAYPNITPQRCSKSTQQNPKPITFRLEYGRDVNSQKSENNLRKTKSSSQHEQFISPKGVASTKKAMAYGKQHTVIKEISSTASRSEEAGEPSHSDISHANKAATSSASRSLSQGKRPLTIPTEPNFPNVHIPKCCARKVA
ncbi:uncharacterized protein LOC114289912 isoform X2 [Camellia sinensis]|uniref:Uncharacterized protein n=1 Tax=Camellia sinensis var. sinensis TaxID=542762 RepID=A0A4S4DQC2_CAMSN|nr:uncharacterized protein LOC114289912 isoform X2 [Camellia sinensis]THG04914.1 hypothetical protein TEA_005732 [Camellia sinensis var. sinensis]